MGLEFVSPLAVLLLSGTLAARTPPAPRPDRSDTIIVTGCLLLGPYGDYTLSSTVAPAGFIMNSVALKLEDNTRLLAHVLDKVEVTGSMLPMPDVPRPAGVARSEREDHDRIPAAHQNHQEDQRLAVSSARIASRRRASGVSIGGSGIVSAWSCADGGRPSRRRSSSPSITSISSSRRVTVSSLSRLLGQDVARLVVRVGEDALDLGVDQPRRVFAVQSALLRHRDVEEPRPLVAVVVDRAERVAHPELGDHRARDVGGALEIVLRAGRDLAERDLFGRPPASSTASWLSRSPRVIR